MRRAGVAALACLALVAAGPFVLDDYTISLLVRSFLFAAVALTVDLLWGYSGFLSFGQSAFFGLGAYAAALTFTQLGFSPGAALLALGIAVGGAVLLAAVQGWLSFYPGASPLYASVVSLVVPVVATQVLFSGGTFTGSSSGLTGYDTFDITMPGWFWITGGGLVALTALAWVFVRSDAGRVLVALRDNETRCAYLGLRTNAIRILLLVVTGVVAAVAGFGYGSYSGVVAPELSGFVLGTQMVIWVALGGRGSLIGPVLGAILIDLTSAYLSGSLPFLWQLLVGLAFILVIVLLPQGLFPALGGLLRRAGRAGAAPPPVLVSAAAAAPRTGAGIDLQGVAKHFGALSVLQDITLRAAPGELVSLVGPNGAGKTTLMRCMSDGAERSAGQIRLNGHDIGRAPPYRCVGFGLGRKFQTATVFDTMTVAGCLRIARTRRVRPSIWQRRRQLALPPAALEVLRATGLDQRLGETARALSHGQKQSLELAMVLALEPAILLLDEPTAGLTAPERALIGGILTGLARDHGLCILLVEHDLDFVRDISSRIVVLHQGRLVLDGSVAEVAGSELVRAIYSGEPH